MHTTIYTMCAVLLIGMVGCQSSEPIRSNEALFTLPLERDEAFTAWELNSHYVYGKFAFPTTLVAPQDSYVLEARQGTVHLAHFEAPAVLVLDDVDTHWLQEGDELCAGDTFGRTQPLRVHAHWGLDEFSNTTDLSLVRTVRGNVIETLADARPADVLHSALGVNPAFARSTDVNRLPCAYDREDDEEDVDEESDMTDRSADEAREEDGR